MYKEKIREFFNGNYRTNERYWWKNNNRYSINEDDHTPYYSCILKAAKSLKDGRVLDLGAGEGADAIRLAKLGLTVDAVEMSDVAAEKIVTNATINNVNVNVICSDIELFEYRKNYDIIMCNGVLHYLDDNAKLNIIAGMQSHTNSNGINCISLFSTFSPTPLCHQIVSVFPEPEGGTVEACYVDWECLYRTYEHEKKEESHDGMDAHTHSFIKMIARRKI